MGTLEEKDKACSAEGRPWHRAADVQFKAAWSACIASKTWQPLGACKAGRTGTARDLQLARKPLNTATACWVLGGPSALGLSAVEA